MNWLRYSGRIILALGTIAIGLWATREELLPVPVYHFRLGLLCYLVVAEVEHVNRWATADLRPHLTVVLDLEPQTGLGRFEERDRIEGQSIEFHQRVRQGFLDLAAADPDHYLVLDARAPVEEIAVAIRERVEAQL